MNPKKKVLFIRFSSIGDIVLTTPLLRSLKEQQPETEVHFLVKKQFRGVVENNPNIDKIHEYHGNFREMLKQLRTENFTFVADLQNNIRSNRIRRRLGVTYAKVNKINVRKWIYVAFKIDKLPRKHIVEQYFDTLRAFNIKNDNKGLDFYSEPDANDICKQIPEFAKNGYLVAVTGAAHFTKQIPPDLFVEILNKANKPVIFTGGTSDAPKANEIIKKLNVPAFNACGICSIGQSAEIIKMAKVVITPDTGAMHIASAFYRPTVSLWGNTVPEFGMYSYMPQNQSLYHIAEVKGLKCRPCTKIGYKHCPKKHFKCMNNQNVSEIVEKITQFWSLE
jgi:ADP-heptose:LPS heptosyltransferase